MRKRNGMKKIATTLTVAAMLSTTVTAPVSPLMTASAAEADAEAGKTDTLVAADGKDVIKNGDFKDTDTSMWSASLGKSKITAETSDTAIYDDVKTYGKIDRDPKESATYESFAQDITDGVKDYNGAVYSYEFWVKLSDDYKDAPAEQRKVDFSPVMTVDGKDTYMGSYSPEITGTASQTLEVGKWTKFEGTFKVAWKGKLDKLVLRIIEQGTEYGNGVCVKGDYFLAGFKMIRTQVEKKEIEKDIPSLKNVVASENGLGKDAIAGTSLTNDEITDDTLMELVEKHFNAVTLGNELKLDCMLGYHNDACPEGSLKKAEINGKEIDVPTLDHSRADKMLDKIVEWNTAHPEEKIRVRGHVFVWHSQAPEWFFHEDYDMKKPLVSKDTMNLRLEWYIKTMLTYYTGAESKYKDLFYGWDVVNEAVVDDHYRTAEEGSIWAKVYGSEEYIINAFTYANKYAPESLELYYNDYNEYIESHVTGICKLLKDVKAKEGKAGEGTRITGFGMQGHWNFAAPVSSEYEKAIRAFAKIVDKLQITEADIKASSDYDGSEALKGAEFVKQAYKYKEFYELFCKLDKEPDIEISGFTIWGVIDGHSWLKVPSNVGGGEAGAEQARKNCPLLFDDDYKAKPAYWAFADPSKLEPEIKTVTFVQSEDGSFEHGESYEFEGSGVKASFIPVWNSKDIKVQVDVEDSTEDATDEVSVFIAQNDDVKKLTVKRSEAAKTETGYMAEVKFDASALKKTDELKMDVLVINGTQKAAYNDLKFTQDESSKYFAKVLRKPFAEISKGTVKVDGVMDNAWKSAVTIPLEIALGAKAKATAKALWDEENLYVYYEVEDAVLNADAEAAHEKDSIETFIDENNGKTDAYEADDKQYRVNYKNEQSFNGQKCTKENVTSVAKQTKNGYVVEAAFKWTDIKPAEGSLVGLEFQVNDADATGKRIGTLSWYDESGNGWSSPGVFGTVVLGAAKPVPAEETKPADTKEDKEKTTKLAKVTGVKSTKVTVKSAKISWKKVASAKKYTVSYKAGKAKWKTVSVKKTAYTIKGLKKNTKVKVKVQAVSGKTKGAFSKVVSFKTKKK